MDDRGGVNIWLERSQWMVREESIDGGEEPADGVGGVGRFRGESFDGARGVSEWGMKCQWTVGDESVDGGGGAIDGRGGVSRW